MEFPPSPVPNPAPALWSAWVIERQLVARADARVEDGTVQLWTEARV